MFEKGPGEGFHAAKDAALSHDPHLRCEAVYYNGRREGFVVLNKAGKVIGTGKLSRDAWCAAYYKVGGSFPVEIRQQ